MNGAEVKFPSMGIVGIEELVETYRQYDLESSEIREKNGFHCLPGCGACCYKPSSQISVAVFEMVPMAIQLLLQGKADAVLRELESDDIDQIPCIIYQKNSEDGRLGYCSEYSFRPLICRLFGGGTRIKRNGLKELLLCKFLKDEHRLNQELLDQLSEEFPVSSEFSSLARGHNQAMDTALLPLNVALRQAIEYVMFRAQWCNPENPEPDGPPVNQPNGGLDHAA